MYEKNETNLIVNLADKFESWWLLFHIAGDINNERWLINLGLDEETWINELQKEKENKESDFLV